MCEREKFEIGSNFCLLTVEKRSWEKNSPSLVRFKSFRLIFIGWSWRSVHIKSAKRITFSQEIVGFGHFSSIYFGPSLLFQIVIGKIFNFRPIDLKIDGWYNESSRLRERDLQVVECRVFVIISSFMIVTLAFFKVTRYYRLFSLSSNEKY